MALFFVQACLFNDTATKSGFLSLRRFIKLKMNAACNRCDNKMTHYTSFANIVGLLF